MFTGASWVVLLSLVGVTGGVVEEAARGLEGVWTERGGCFMVLAGIWYKSCSFTLCLLWTV